MPSTLQLLVVVCALVWVVLLVVAYRDLFREPKQ